MLISESVENTRAEPQASGFKERLEFSPSPFLASQQDQHIQVGYRLGHLQVLDLPGGSARSAEVFRSAGIAARTLRRIANACSSSQS